jgi:hypothetical protein
MNEIAKAMWDTAIAHLEAAQADEDVNIAICNTGIGELALKAAQFAVNNPALVAGIDEYAPPMPGGAIPAGPTQGPKFWGAPGP